jgi:hypothetical protein
MRSPDDLGKGLPRVPPGTTEFFISRQIYRYGLCTHACNVHIYPEKVNTRETSEFFQSLDKDSIQWESVILYSL